MDCRKCKNQLWTSLAVVKDPMIKKIIFVGKYFKDTFT